MTPRSVLALITIVFGLALAGPPASAADWREHGPQALVMTYRVAPAARTGFKTAVRAATLPRLESLRTSGALTAYHVLANRYVDTASWDLMVILEFRSSKDLAAWRAVEAAAPAGLSPGALTLVSQVETAPGDVMRAKPAASHPGDPAPVWLVVPYNYLTSTDDYLTYVDGYLLPQVDGWIQEGALSAYDIFLPRYPAGRVWSSLLMLAYRGDEGLARRDIVVKSVRARLAATNSDWKAFADNKARIRTEMQPVVADELTPP